MAIIYVDCPRCDSEIEFRVFPIAGRSLQVDWEKQHCTCELTGDEVHAAEEAAAAKYE